MNARTLTPALLSEQRIAALAALFLGSFLVFMTGFAPLESVHNAAHDTRHSADFPCH